MQEILKIKQLFAQNNLKLNTMQAEQFYKYYSLLIETNKVMNLTAITDFEDVIIKHFIDSIINCTHFSACTSVCDIGTGAGFPGIPLKIMRPDLKITLVDSLNKRITFLNDVINALNLKDITAIHTRAQELQQIVPRETFDYTVSRAVAPLNILLELCIPYTKPSGEMVAYKGNNIALEIDSAKNALKVLNSTIKTTEEYQIVGKEQYNRNIIYITKIDHTDSKYPRQKNKITQNPL